MTIGAADLAGPDELVEGQPGPRPLAVAEPADPGRQALERHALLGHRDPAPQAGVVGEELEDGLGRSARMSAGSPDSATQRNGPRPSQNCGRMNAGTKPG